MQGKKCDPVCKTIKLSAWSLSLKDNNINSEQIFQAKIFFASDFKGPLDHLGVGRQVNCLSTNHSFLKDCLSRVWNTWDISFQHLTGSWKVWKLFCLRETYVTWAIYHGFGRNTICVTPVGKYFSMLRLHPVKLYKNLNCQNKSQTRHGKRVCFFFFFELS